MNWRGGHVTVSIKLLHLRFSLLLSHFQPIFVSFVTVSAVLSCMLCFQSLVGIVPWQVLNDLWMPSIWVVWVISYDWWMVSYLPANSIQLQQALKLVHPNIPRNCWSPVGLEFWKRHGLETAGTKDQMKWRQTTYCIIKMRITLIANRGRAYSSEYIKKPPHIWNSDQGCTNCPLRRPHCCSKSLKPFSLHTVSVFMYLFPVLFFVILLSPSFFFSVNSIRFHPTDSIVCTGIK